uniref:Uncharacterized protein n=1 Tax=Aegilops tauschii subsp. strangulata TaxID=200361 RepID=A0A453C535_AEGTS
FPRRRPRNNLHRRRLDPPQRAAQSPARHLDADPSSSPPRRWSRIRSTRSCTRTHPSPPDIGRLLSPLVLGNQRSSRRRALPQFSLVYETSISYCLKFYGGLCERYAWWGI